jgi:hypothetical protein
LPDIRSNLYAVGVMLWGDAGRQTTVRWPTYSAVVERIKAGDRPRLTRPSGGWRSNSASVADVVARDSERSRSRFNSAKAMAEAIEAAGAPATHEEVAALVDDLAGNTLVTRRKVVERARRYARAAQDHHHSEAGRRIAQTPDDDGQGRLRRRRDRAQTLMVLRRRGLRIPRRESRLDRLR